MRLKLISCDVFEREVQSAAAHSSNHIEVEFPRKVPHQLSDTEMVRTFQVLINRARRSQFHAVLMVAGSCKHGLNGLRARSIPLVLPRAKDCISLLLERTVPSALSVAPKTWAHARGERTVGSRTRQAMRPTVIFGVTPVKRPAPRAREALKWREHLGGQATGTMLKPWPAQQRLSLLEMLVEGYWNYDEFLVIPPGWQVRVNYDQGTIAAEPLPL